MCARMRYRADLPVPVVADRLVAFDDGVPVQPVRRVEVVVIGGGHLAGRLVVGHAAEPGAHGGQRDRADLFFLSQIVPVNRQSAAQVAA